ncbi:hypothetical protein AB6D11_06070 [Vibrio splendidus]
MKTIKSPNTTSLPEMNSTNSRRVRLQPLTSLLNSQAFNKIKLLVIKPQDDGGLEVSALVRMSHDFRWCFLKEDVSNSSEAFNLASTMCHTHSDLHTNERNVMATWLKELKEQAFRISTVGVNMISTEIEG